MPTPDLGSREIAINNNAQYIPDGNPTTRLKFFDDGTAEMTVTITFTIHDLNNNLKVGPMPAAEVGFLAYGAYDLDKANHCKSSTITKLTAEALSNKTLKVSTDRSDINIVGDGDKRESGHAIFEKKR